MRTRPTGPRRPTARVRVSEEAGGVSEAVPGGGCSGGPTLMPHILPGVTDPHPTLVTDVSCDAGARDHAALRPA